MPVFSEVIKTSASNFNFWFIMATLDQELIGLETLDETIRLTNIPRDKTVSIQVAHSDTSAFNAMVSVLADWFTVKLKCDRKP